MSVTFNCNIFLSHMFSSKTFSCAIFSNVGLLYEPFVKLMCCLINGKMEFCALYSKVEHLYEPFIQLYKVFFSLILSRRTSS